MRGKSVAGLTVLFLAVGVALAGAQSFLGGVRGAVRDANGVIPGAQVVLTEQQTGATRTVDTNEVGEYVFSAIPAGTYTLRATLTGFKTFVQTDLRIGTQQFLTLDVTLDVGTLEETITVTGQSRAGRDVERVDRHAAQHRDDGDAAVGGAHGVHDGHDGADGRAVRRHAVQPAAGSDQRRADVARRRHPPRQQLHARRRADHRHAQPRERAPVDRVARGRQGPGAHLRCGDGPDRRRRVQHDAQVGHQQRSAATASTRCGRSGARPTTTSARSPAVRSRRARTASPAAPSAVRSSRTRRSSGSRPRATTTRRRETSACCFRPPRCGSGDFSGLTNASGQPVIIYDPLTGQPFPGNRIPAGRINPVAANMLQYLPLPDTDRDNGSDNYTRTSLIKSKYAQLYSVKLEHKITDNVSLSGFYLYNKTQEPCANYFGSADQNEPNPLRRPQRLLPGAQAADSGDQQHLGARTTARCWPCASA